MHNHDDSALIAKAVRDAASVEFGGEIVPGSTLDIAVNAIAADCASRQALLDWASVMQRAADAVERKHGGPVMG